MNITSYEIGKNYTFEIKEISEESILFDNISFRWTIELKKLGNFSNDNLFYNIKQIPKNKENDFHIGLKKVDIEFLYIPNGCEEIILNSELKFINGINSGCQKIISRKISLFKPQILYLLTNKPIK